ncbi:hypothetical protein [Halodesulfovibrio spirochaetisodalis]|uniref:Uncharacterized protein n=1 Tax=Halodesulfovibrio spirochaetisodalis TaxID=1560234 RepID=A0A1B7XMM5_9BACT|nr:hypothetical protein [Halodesulfovibrio spirochaetisodalis]OBQ56764.1 hypothetical protein SP90_01380 [Halodesulfovibrio spirochaetisodalis]
MQSFIKNILNFFFIAVIATTALTLVGILYLWFGAEPTRNELPYLGWLLTVGIAEIFAIVFMYARKGIQYLPEIVINEDEKETFDFMERFISRGSSVTIVSNRISWLQRAPRVLNKIVTRAQTGTGFDIITPSDIDNDLKEQLEQAGVTLFLTEEEVPPEARFTLINGNRSGAEELAIARGAHPKHEISVFDNNSGPQIIALAKDIIRKSKGRNDD